MSGDLEPNKRAGGRKKSIVMIGGALTVLGAVSGGLWFTGIFQHVFVHPRNTAAVVEKQTYIDLPDIISNLDTGNHRPAFVKVHAKLEVHASDATVLQAAMPQILDIFQTYLRSTKPEELRSGEGTYRLREALMNRIDGVVAPAEVTDLLFTELLVQ